MKFFLKKLLFFTLCSFFYGVYAHDAYAPFTLGETDIQAVLAKTHLTTCTSKDVLPADITFVCADIKYKDGQLKFCECGDGLYMSFRTANVAINDKDMHLVSPYWGIFWHYLAQFDLPIWHVEARGEAHAMALEELAKIGGKYVNSISMLAKDTLFKKLSRRPLSAYNNIKKYLGIVVYRARDERQRENKIITDFKKAHPQFLYVNRFACPFMRRKDTTFALFEQAGLSSFLPRLKLYDTHYTPALTASILRDFQGVDRFVIKPTSSTLSCGVNVIDKKDLDAFLKLILKDKQKLTSEIHRCFTYWRLCNPTKFVVSEYAPSREIIKDGHPYDPTMRIVFMMHHNKGIIGVNVIAGFWKIPVTPLDEKKGSLTDKHVTIAHSGAYFSGILVDKKDWTDIECILQSMLPQWYETMLKLGHPANVVKGIEFPLEESK